MPLFPGIFASAISGRLTPADAGSMFPIQAIHINSDVSSVEFTNIDQSYKHLQIRALVRTTRAAVTDAIYWRVNSDGGSNYTLHSLYGTGSGNALGDTGVNLTYGYYIAATGATQTSNIFSGAIIDIPDYTNTNKFKHFRTVHGFDANGSGQIFVTSSLWRSKNAMTSIRFESQNAGNIVAGSTFALYGIK